MPRQNETELSPLLSTNYHSIQGVEEVRLTVTEGASPEEKFRSFTKNLTDFDPETAFPLYDPVVFNGEVCNRATLLLLKYREELKYGQITLEMLDGLETTAEIRNKLIDKAEEAGLSVAELFELLLTYDTTYDAFSFLQNDWQLEINPLAKDFAVNHPGQGMDEKDISKKIIDLKSQITALHSHTLRYEWKNSILPSVLVLLAQRIGISGYHVSCSIISLLSFLSLTMLSVVAASIYQTLLALNTPLRMLTDYLNRNATLILENQEKHCYLEIYQIDNTSQEAYFNGFPNPCFLHLINFSSYSVTGDCMSLDRSFPQYEQQETFSYKNVFFFYAIFPIATLIISVFLVVNGRLRRSANPRSCEVKLKLTMLSLFSLLQYSMFTAYQEASDTPVNFPTNNARFDYIAMQSQETCRQAFAFVHEVFLDQETGEIRNSSILSGGAAKALLPDMPGFGYLAYNSPAVLPLITGASIGVVVYLLALLTTAIHIHIRNPPKSLDTLISEKSGAEAISLFRRYTAERIGVVKLEIQQESSAITPF